LGITIEQLPIRNFLARGDLPILLGLLEEQSSVSSPSEVILPASERQVFQLSTSALISE
jgi:hypothetical protein